MWRTLAYFRVVPPVPPLLTSTFAVVTVGGMVVILVDPARTVGALTAVLLLQLFAAASGFTGPARRGYYDLLLTRGDRRLHIALAQWTMSIAAGVAGWIAIAGVEVARTGAAHRALAPGTLTALVLASTVPWATTVALPRFAGAVGWLLIMVLTWTLAPALTSQAGPWAARATAVLLLPGVLVGSPFGDGTFVAAPSFAFAAVSMGIALRWVSTTDVPLETAQ